MFVVVSHSAARRQAVVLQLECNIAASTVCRHFVLSGLHATCCCNVTHISQHGWLPILIEVHFTACLLLFVHLLPTAPLAHRVSCHPQAAASWRVCIKRACDEQVQPAELPAGQPVPAVQAHRKLVLPGAHLPPGGWGGMCIAELYCFSCLRLYCGCRQIRQLVSKLYFLALICFQVGREACALLSCTAFLVRGCAAVGVRSNRWYPSVCCSAACMWVEQCVLLTLCPRLYCC